MEITKLLVSQVCKILTKINIKNKGKIEIWGKAKTKWILSHNGITLSTFLVSYSMEDK